MARVPAGIKRDELTEYLDVDEQIKTLTARRNILRDKADRAYGRLLDAGAINLPFTGVYGKVVVSVNEAKTFDADAFATAHPAEQHAEFYRPAIVRDAVSKEQREPFLVPTRRISVRRAA